MKKDRNCGMNQYPIYPNYGMPAPGMGPAMVPIQMTPNYQGQSPIMPNIDIINNNQDDDLMNIKRQLNNLEKRVSRLENSLNNNSFGNKYTDSNYHVL